MKFICLGYGEEKKWNEMANSERDVLLEECYAYDDELFEKGYWVDGGQALQSVRTAKTLRSSGGKVMVTDGPFAETKEQLGGFGTLEVRDIAHAIELMTKHPCARISGPFEIRPVDEETLKRSLELDAKFHKAGSAADPKSKAVRFACLGYINYAAADGRSKEEFEAMINECLTFDEQRRKNGQWLGGVGLQPPETAKTLRSQGSRVVATDGPFAETKEWLGGVVVQGFVNMNQAIEVLSTHPALPYGIAIEIRPIDEEMNARWEARHSRGLNEIRRPL